MSHSEHIVIVGGGLAGATTAIELRKRGHAGQITLISSEEHLPYERPPLSKDFLQGKSAVKDFSVREEEYYTEHDITLQRGVTVTGLDRAERVVRLSDGSSLGYDQLVLATGARPNTGGSAPIEGAQLPGVHLLRSIEDSQALRENLGEGSTLAIVGSGWIGMEVAASATQLGAKVTVITPDTVPLAAVLGERFGEHLLKIHRAQGVDFKLQTKVRSIHADHGELLVDTDAEPIRADHVLLAIGAVPNTELAAAAGIQTDSGIVVDASLRSSDSNVLAIGDVAQAFNTTLRRQLRVEHWDNAARQGALAASTLTGGDDEYDWYPYFFTDQFDLGMEFVGQAEAGDEAVFRGGDDDFIVFYLREGVIRAAMNVNLWDVNDTLRGLIGRSIEPERLRDPQIDLESL
ncbi:FAD-dependent oxidoreductase [Glutamicibacter endophyticus]